MTAKVDVVDVALIAYRVDCEHGCDLPLSYDEADARDHRVAHVEAHRCPGCGHLDADTREASRCEVPDCLDGEIIRKLVTT